MSERTTPLLLALGFTAMIGLACWESRVEVQRESAMKIQYNALESMRIVRMYQPAIEIREQEVKLMHDWLASDGEGE